MGTGHIKAVIWDMGGVILRTENEESRRQLAAEYNIAIDDLYKTVFNSTSAEMATIGTIAENEHWQAVATTLGVPGGKIFEFQDKFWGGDGIDKELIDFIKGLNKVVKTGLLSNAWSGARQYLNRKNACDQVFQFSMFSCEVRLRKPDAHIYEKILALMQVKADEAIFVDDILENVEAAKAVGIHAIQFKSTEQAIANVNALLNV
jgi:epoxide hydrolase-like predicted phosphatase